MIRTGGVVHGIAACKDCGWSSESYKNILAISAIHAKRYKHKVWVEVGYDYIYDGRQK